MENNAPDNLTWYLRIAEQFGNDLAGIRHWTNLKAGIEAPYIWIRDLRYAQITSATVKSIPEKRCYYEKNGRLFPQGSLLPECAIPAVLWTPIQRAFPVQLPLPNPHFFGYNDTVPVRMVPAKEAFPACAVLTEADLLAAYLRTAPLVRYSHLRYVLYGRQKVLIIGTPMLPLPGITFYLYGRHLLPVGTQFEWPFLADGIHAQLSESTPSLLLWNTEGNYLPVSETDFTALSPGSLRATLDILQFTPNA